LPLSPPQLPSPYTFMPNKHPLQISPSMGGTFKPHMISSPLPPTRHPIQKIFLRSSLLIRKDVVPKTGTVLGTSVTSS
jgi:hypothetical protein